MGRCYVLLLVYDGWRFPDHVLRVEVAVSYEDPEAGGGGSGIGIG